jgi:RimJ/RimL family protein N-acetyltransferase
MGTNRPYQIERDGRELFVASDIGENLLGAAYLRMVHEGLLDMMFWLSAPTLRGFLDWACSRKDVVVIGSFVADPSQGTVELAGLGWVREIQVRNGKKYADVGELFFRQYQSMGVTRDLASLMLDFAFEQVGVSALYGLTPRPNVAALRFMRAVGFEHTAEIPELAAWNGQNCPAVISWMTKAMWQVRSGRARGGGENQSTAA